MEARQWALGELDRLKHGSAEETQFDTLLDLIDWYKKYFLHEPVYEKGKKVEGVKDWERSRAKLDRIGAHFGPKRLRGFSETDLKGYAMHRRKVDKVSTTTINRDFALMRAMFKKGRDVNAALTIPKFPINTGAEVERDRVMTRDEEKRILAACDELEVLTYERNGKTVTTANHRTNRGHLAAIIIIAVDTAMRKGEIFSLEWGDVDLSAGVITLRPEVTKTGKGRKIGMTPRVKAAFEGLPRSGGKVFSIQSASKAFRTACERAEIADLHFHDLRHTGTTRMIRAGIPHAEVMKITGHRQLKTFLRYLNLVDDTVATTAQLLARYLEDD